jgi:hypothetical protein
VAARRYNDRHLPADLTVLASAKLPAACMFAREGCMGMPARVPKIEQIAAVYGIIVMMVYGWTAAWSLWKAPSWLLVLAPADILGLQAVALAVDGLESLAVLLVLLCASVVLPAKWLRESFNVRGSTLVILLLGYTMFFSYSFKSIEPKDFPQDLVGWSPAAIALAIVLTTVVDRIRFLRNGIAALAARSVIFLYLSIPASIAALLYVVVRNLLWNS